MHLLILAGFAIGGLGMLWVCQTLALLAVGERPLLVGPLRDESSSSVVGWVLKLSLQAGLLAILLLYPLAIGEDPIAYHLARLTPVRWMLLIRTMAMTVTVLTLLLAINISAGGVHLAPRYAGKALAGKVARSFAIPLPLALVEEALFRGVGFDQLQRGLGPGVAGKVVAVLGSALVFSAVHFLRRQKRVVLPAIGLFALGVVLSMAYLAGGCTYWLPVAIHAGGVWYIQVMRPFVKYEGPAWLIGYSSYPICGVLGIAAMAVLIALVLAGAGA